MFTTLLGLVLTVKEAGGLVVFGDALTQPQGLGFVQHGREQADVYPGVATAAESPRARAEWIRIKQAVTGCALDP